MAEKRLFLATVIHEYGEKGQLHVLGKDAAEVRRHLERRDDIEKVLKVEEI